MLHYVYYINILPNIFIVDSSILYLSWFYDICTGICISISVIVLVFLIIGYFQCYISNMYNIIWLEIFWTVFPILVLCWLIFPSIYLLYTLELSSMSTSITIFITGHQWYWTYFDSINLVSNDSFCISSNDLIYGNLRTLEVDNPIVLPLNIWCTLTATSVDVLHSWSIPSLGINIDSIPYHYNTIQIQPCLVGIYYGMCSELCGVNHSFIPTSIEIVDIFIYVSNNFI